MTDTPKSTDGDVVLFLAFLDDQRGAYDGRLERFPPDDDIVQSIHAAHSAVLDAMMSMVGAGHHPRQIIYAMVAAAGSVGGRMSCYKNESSLALLIAQILMYELNQGIAKQEELEDGTIPKAE